MAFNDTYRESIQDKHIRNVAFTSTAKGITNEANAIKNPHQILANQIPAIDVVTTYGSLTASGIAAGVVEEHIVQLTADPTVNNNLAWLAYETNCTTPGHSARGNIKLAQWMRYTETQYKLRLFADDGVGNPDYSSEILPSYTGFNWEYDAAGGTVYFDSNPIAYFTAPLWGVFYTYVGDTVKDVLDATSSGSSGTTDHSALSNLDYAVSGHTGFQPSGDYVTTTQLTTVSGDIVAQISDLTGYATEAYVTTVSGDIQSQINSLDYYTTSQVDSIITTTSGDIVSQIPSLAGYATESYIATVSGDLQTQIDSKPDTLLELSDTPSVYDANKYLRSTASGTEWSTVSGITDHSLLSNLDYESSGHTGFVSTAQLTTASGDIVAQIPTDFYTTSEVDTLLTTTSGDIVSQIPSLNGYATEAFVATVSGDLQSQIDQKADVNHTHTFLDLTDTPSSYDVNKYLRSTASGVEWATVSGGSSGTTDHSALTNLDYASSGHTGFQPAGDYTTAAQLATTSGDIVAQIPSLNGYATEVYVDNAINTLSGTIQTDLGILYNIDTFFDGTFIEHFSTTVSGNGTTVILSLEKYGGGDLTMTFSDGETILDCTPAQTIELTVGSDSSPQGNWIYILKSTKTLTKSTTGFPTSSEHIKVCYLLVPSAVHVQTEGVYVYQNWNDHMAGTDGQGHLAHICEHIRRQGAIYFSGIDAAGTDQDTNASYFDYVSGSESYFKATSGVIYQMHRHAYGALDSRTNEIYVLNWNANPYYEINNLVSITADANGNTLTNRYFNLVFIGVANETGTYQPILCNLPTGSYSNATNAQQDTGGYDVLTIPREFNLESTTGFLICRMTLRNNSGNITHISTVDLRGTTPQTATGGIAGIQTNFPDNLFEVYNVTDGTKAVMFDVSGVTTGTTRTLTVQDADGTIALVSDIPTDYYTQSEVNTLLTTTSGDIIAQIPSLTGYATESYVDNADTTLSGYLQSQIDSLDYYTTSEVNSIISTASGTLQSDIDTNSLNINKLETINSDRSEPTGFINRTDSFISFDDGTQALTISGTYSYYIAGVKYDISSPKTLAITTSGINYFYLDSNENLNVAASFDVETILKNNAYVAAVYWDPIDSKHIYFGDERHSIMWDWNSHAYHHTTVGTKYQSGLGLTDVTSNITFEGIYNADDSQWEVSVVQSSADDFVVSVAQNHTPNGSRSLDLTGSENNDIAQFTRPTGNLNLASFNNLEGYIWINLFDGTDEVSIYGWNTVSGTIVGSSVNISSYVNTSTVNEWQNFVIPLIDMNLTGETLDSIRIQTTDSPDCYLDDIIFYSESSPTNSGIQIGVASGIIRDEDLLHNIAGISAGEEKYVVFYREGTGGWTHDAVSAVPLITISGGGRLAYNYFDNSSWSQVEVPNFGYVACHIFATNDTEYPIISVQGQNSYTDIGAAREAISTEINDLIIGDMPFEEFIAIGSLIAQTSNDYTNSHKARFSYIDSAGTVNWQDFRGLVGVSTGGTSISSHHNLSDLTSGDDHPQYHNNTRGDARYYKKIEIDNLLTNVSGSVITNHSELNQLDYASAGHTGFQPAGDYATNASLSNVSGTLQTQIDNLDYYTTAQVNSLLTTTSGDIVSQIPSLTGYATESYVDTADATLSGYLQNEINNLDYYTTAQVESLITTTSGDIVSQIPSLVGYATEAYVTTVSGDIQSQIDQKADINHTHTLLNLTDTPASYDVGKYLRSTASGTEWATVSGGTGTSDHSLLSNLDYASSGHTGFVSTAQLTTTSGDIVAQIADTLAFNIITDGTNNGLASDSRTIKFTGAGSTVISVVSGTNEVIINTSGGYTTASTASYDVDLTYVSGTIWDYSGASFDTLPSGLTIFVNGVKQKADDPEYYTPSINGTDLRIEFGYSFSSNNWVNAQYLDLGTIVVPVVSGSGGSSIVADVRQTVLSSPRNTKGHADFIGGVGSNTATISGASTPIIMTWADGYDSNGAKDYVYTETSNKSISALASGITNFIYTDYNSGSPIYGVTTTPPTYNYEVPTTITTDAVLAHFEGANNATSYTDVYGKACTFVGISDIDTSQYKFGSSSIRLPGSDSYVSVPINSSVWSKPWTIEVWGRYDSIDNGALQTLFSGDTSYGVDVCIHSTVPGRLGLYLSSNNTSWDLSLGTDPSSYTSLIVANTWYHVAVVYNGTDYRMFLNGNLEVTKATATVVYPSTALFLGCFSNGISFEMFGYVDEFRFSPYARYHESFSEPTEAFEPDPTHYFNIPEMKMYELSNSGWQESNALYLGEAVVGNDGIIDSCVSYAIKGKYISEWSTVGVNATYDKPHNIGVADSVCSSARYRYSSSYKPINFDLSLASTNYYGGSYGIYDRNKVRLRTATNYVSPIMSAYYGAAATNSQTTGQVRFICDRGW